MRRAVTATVTFVLGCVADPVEIGRFTDGADQAWNISASSLGGSDGGSDGGDWPPHPYLSCVASLPAELMDPACQGSCSNLWPPDASGWASCPIACTDADDCFVWDPGGSEVSCDDGHCKWGCDEEHPCPGELECLDAERWPDATHWGECWAPGSFEH